MPFVRLREYVQVGMLHISAVVAECVLCVCLLFASLPGPFLRSDMWKPLFVAIFSLVALHAGLYRPIFALISYVVAKKLTDSFGLVFMFLQVCSFVCVAGAYCMFYEDPFGLFASTKWWQSGWLFAVTSTLVVSSSAGYIFHIKSVRLNVEAEHVKI